MGESDDSLNLAIAKFCQNLRKLSTYFKNNEMETMKIVLNGCQYLESIVIWCNGEYLNEKVALEVFVKSSHRNIYELILYYLNDIQFKSLPEELVIFYKLGKSCTTKISFFGGCC